MNDTNTNLNLDGSALLVLFTTAALISGKAGTDAVDQAKRAVVELLPVLDALNRAKSPEGSHDDLDASSENEDG